MFQPARGTRDFLPEEMIRRNWVIDNIRAVFEAYGYEPLGTPAFESWEMLRIKSGEDAIDQIYYFKDKSDRELGLRFEWTASLARVVATHREIPKPFKRYAIGPIWRYERPSETHRREFWQMDVDIVGVADPIADAETIAVAIDCLKRIGFESSTIRLNDRRILEALVEVAGLPSERCLDIFRAIDKREKIGEEGVLDELKKLGADPKASKRLLELASNKGDPSEIIDSARENLKDSPSGLAACDFILSIVEYSAIYGIEPCIVVDLGLARGLDYYTGPVYEIFAKGYESYGSIAAGGRYDELVQLFGGESTPMTGISMGVDRLVPLLEKKGVFKNIGLTRKIYVIFTSEKVRTKVIEVTQMLRRAGISTDFDLLGRGISRQLEIANRKGVKRVIIVGKKEITEGCVLVRDMVTAEQKKVEIVRLLEEI